MRNVYFRNDIESEEKLILIVYLGDDSVAESTEIHRATNKSVLKKIQECKDLKPQKAYMQVLAQTQKELKQSNEPISDFIESTSTPKNVKQCANKLFYERSKEQLSKDIIYNVYEVGLHLNSFIRFFCIEPEISIICCEYSS